MSQSILLTGVSGYIAKHIALLLLEAGHRVRGSARTVEKGEAVRATLRSHLSDPAAADRFEVVALDLTSDAGWDAAMEGMDVLMHTASPFPMDQSRNPEAIIGPAKDGTRRALEAAARVGVSRVVLTSSTVAITGAPLPAGKTDYDENDWSDPDLPEVNGYGASKTLAERLAWEIAKEKGLSLTVINPGFVLGPPLDDVFGTSIDVMKRILNAEDPAVPRIGFSTVDVRDIAAMHVAALDHPDSAGQRIAGVAGFLWFGDIAEAVAAAAPDRKIVTRKAPNFVVRLLALFDPTLKSVVPSLGKRSEVSNARAKAVLGQEFRDLNATITETARWLVDNKIV